MKTLARLDRAPDVIVPLTETASQRGAEGHDAHVIDFWGTDNGMNDGGKVEFPTRFESCEERTR